jgi:Skp family chaperone for outer membrane proteins
MKRTPAPFLVFLGSAAVIGAAAASFGPAGVGRETLAAQQGPAAGVRGADFPPPRLAVVDTFEVIEKYKRKADLESKLVEKVEKVKKDVEELEKGLKSVDAEIKLHDEGSDEHSRLLLRRTQLQIDLTNLKRKRLAELEEEQNKHIQDIRAEVEREIDGFAKAHRLDVVLEKKIPIEGRQNIKINIPIVRFVKPEIEITEEIVAILNERYRKP